MLADAVTILLVTTGCGFFLSGTVGLLRFPDVYMRLHALTKADNLGLGFIVLGLLWQTPGWTEVMKMLLVWMLALAASATAAHLVARAALHLRQEPWRRS